MPDAFDTAQTEIENQRRAALAAIAANGAAGAHALADAGSQIGSLRKAALDAALSNAAATGAPSGAQREISGIIGRPYDLLSASTQQMAASDAARQAALATATPQYFAQMAAAVPVARTALKSRIDTLNAEAAAKANQQDQLSDSELRTRLLGAGENIKQEALGQTREDRDAGRTERATLRGQRDDLRKVLSVRLAEHRLQPGRGRGTTIAVQNLLQSVKEKIGATKKGIRSEKRDIRGLKANGRERYAIQAGIRSGLDPDLVRGLIQVPEMKQKAEGTIKPASQYRAVSDAAQRAGVGPKALRRITHPSGADQDPTFFEGASAKAQEAIKNGVPLSVFKKDMNQAVKGHGRTKALVIAIYGPAFRG